MPKNSLTESKIERSAPLVPATVNERKQIAIPAMNAYLRPLEPIRPLSIITPPDKPTNHQKTCLKCPRPDAQRRPRQRSELAVCLNYKLSQTSFKTKVCTPYLTRQLTKCEIDVTYFSPNKKTRTGIRCLFVSFLYARVSSRGWCLMSLILRIGDEVGVDDVVDK